MDRCEWDHRDWERLELSETQSQRRMTSWMITVRATAGFFPFFFFLDCKVQGCDFFFLKEGNGEAKAQSQNNENQEANDTG